MSQPRSYPARAHWIAFAIACLPCENADNARRIASLAGHVAETHQHLDRETESGATPVGAAGDGKLSLVNQRLKSLVSDAGFAECVAPQSAATGPAATIEIRKYWEKRDRADPWTNSFEGMNYGIGSLYNAMAIRCEQIPKEKGESPPGFCSESDSMKRLDRYLELPDWEILGDLIEGGNRNYPSSILNSEDLKIHRIYHRALVQDGARGTLAYLRTKAGELTTAEKLKLGQIFGQRFLLNYDTRRAKRLGPSAFGIVELDQVLNASGRNDEQGLWGPAGLYGSYATPEFGGICTDISYAQALILESLGMKDTYVIAYKGAAGGHAAVITRDPNDPKRIYKLDYGNLVAASGKEGGQALDQSIDKDGGKLTDISLSYRLYRTGDDPKLVAVTQSEFGKAMAVFSGSRFETLNPLGTNSISTAGASVNLGGSRLTQLRALTAQDGNGATYLGVGATQRYELSPWAPGQLGVALGQRTFPKSASGLSQDQITRFLHAQLEQGLRTPRVLPERLGLDPYLDSKLTVLGNASHLAGLESPWPTPQGDVFLDVGAKVDHVSAAAPGSQGDISSSAYVGAQLAPGLRDVRNQDVAEFFRFIQPDPAKLQYLQLNFAKIAAQSRIQLSESDQDYAALSALALCGEIGCRGRAELEAAYADIAAGLALQGRLNEDAPPYAEGTDRRIAAKLMIRSALMNLPLIVELSGFKSIEGDDYGSTARAQLNF